LFSLHAGAGELVSEADYFSEQPVVLSASKLSQPVNRAPAAVTVITREMIEASGFRHLVDVLRLVPGFVVGWQGGNVPAATYIGLTNEFPHRMQIMVDGRSVYNPAFGHTTWRGIPVTLDEVERIEVVRGPNAANDGLNSMLGTVHIYTRHTSMTQGGMGELAAGDQQYAEVNLRHGGETGQGNWRLSLLAREDERHGVSQDHATDMQMSFRGDYRPTHQDELMLQLGLSRGLWQGTNVGQLVYDAQHADFLNGFGNLYWKHTLGRDREWSLRVHHTFNQNQESLPPLDPVNADYRITASGVVANYIDQAAEDVRTSVTGEYRLNRVRLPALLDSDAYIEDRIYSLAGAVEWSLSPQWVLHAAVMLEHHSDSGHTNVSPRLAVNWLPSSEHSFRAGISQGFSALGTYVNHTDISIGNLIIKSNEDVEAEQIDSVELGYLFHKPEWGLNLDLRAYYNRIEGIAVLEPVAPLSKTRTYVNGPEATQRGLEYQLRWNPTPHGWLVLSQSWCSADSDYYKNSNYESSVPRQTLSLLAAHPIAGIDASLGYYRIKDMFWIGGLRDDLSQYNRLDLRLAKGWKTRDGHFQAALVLQGLLGEEFESFAEDLYKRQYFERRGYVSLKYEFR
jgi:iron complex outermembrane receptor protein